MEEGRGPGPVLEDGDDAEDEHADEEGGLPAQGGAAAPGGPLGVGEGEEEVPEVRLQRPQQVRRLPSTPPAGLVGWGGRDRQRAGQGCPDP